MSVSEEFEVSFHILGDIIDDRNYTQIIKSIKKMDGGIISVIHSMEDQV
jgi:hypothetical protein